MDLISEICGVNPSLEGSSESNGVETAMRIFEHLNAENRSLASLCRTCLVVKSDMYSLVRSGNDELLPINGQLPDMFSSFTNIQVDLDEGLPLQICELCKVQLENGYEFRLKCLNSNSILKKYLKPMGLCLNASMDNKIITVSDLINKPEVYADGTYEEQLIEDIQYLEDISDNDLENAFNTAKDPIATVEEPMLEQEKKGTSEEQLQNIVPHSKEVEEEVEMPLVVSWQKFGCSFCEKKFNTARALKGHVTCMHSSQNPSYKHECRRCKERFATIHDLHIHEPLHIPGDGKQWTCSECPKQFERRALLKRHIRRHMQGKRYSCADCGKTFAERYALHRHVRVHTGQQPEKKYQCEVCAKRFSESHLLQRHMSCHSDARPCVCAVCGKRFATERLLTSHSMVHKEDKPYACHYCFKRFRHEATRSTHHRTHTGERPYICAVCGKSFIQTSNLSLHMRSHTGEKPYKCPTCKRCFSSSSTLKSHIRTHTGDRPYTCHHCGKKYSRKGFNAHCRTHMDIRPFFCTMCTRRFATATRLRDHERVHTGEKPYECANCGRKFTTKSQLQKHIKTYATKKKKVKKERKTKVYKVAQPIFIINEDDAQKIGLTDLKDAQNIHIFDPSQIVVDTELDHAVGVSEVVLQDEGEMKTHLLKVEDVEANGHEYQTEALCLDNSINYVNSDGSYADDINLVTIDGTVESIASEEMLESNTVKLYQLDQS